MAVESLSPQPLLFLPWCIYNRRFLPANCGGSLYSYKMKRSSIAGLFQQLQRENVRLKEQLVGVRRDLNAFQDKLMQQLALADPSKLIYDSPMLCLEAFLSHLASFSHDQQQKDSALAHAQKNLLLVEQRVRKADQEAETVRKRATELQSSLREAEERTRTAGEALMAAQRMVQSRQDELQARIREAQDKEQARAVALDEERRVALAAALHQSKKELLELREQLQGQFLTETVRLREEVKEKDDKIRSLIKGLLKYDKGEKVSGAEVAEMRELVAYIGNVEQLNMQLGQSRDEAFQLRRENKDTLNKKSATELKNSELRNEISNLLLRGERREEEKAALQQRIDQLQTDLSAEKDSSKRLEHYYEVKWHGEFDRVKSHLEKAYQDRVEDHAKELQAKKAEVAAKIHSYLFLHAEDQKIIQDLKKRIEQLTREVDSKALLLAHERDQTTELKMAIRETDRMMAEELAGVAYAWSLRVRGKEEQVRQLEQAISCTSNDKQSVERAAQQLSASLQEGFTLEKQQLEEQHLRQKQELAVAQQGQMETERQRYQEMLMGMRRSIQQSRQQHEKTLKEERSKFAKEISQLQASLQKERGEAEEAALGAQGRQKALKKEISQLKQYYMKKIYDLQREVDNKKTSLRVVASKSDNDEQLKKELRLMIEERTHECRHLQKVKQDLEDELEAKQSEIHHLTHENTGLRMSKDDWLQVIVEVRDEFMKELTQLDRNHHRQVDLLRSRLWELENIISKRPIRIQDEKRIRCLSEQNKHLENKVDIKEAENIVLKQIKHYYEKRIEGSKEGGKEGKEGKEGRPTTHTPAQTHTTSQQQMAVTHAHLTAHQSAKPHTLLLPKRPRRPHLQSRSNEQDEGETANDIRKMKKYLQRFSAVEAEGRGKPIRPSSRNLANRSMES